MAALSTSNVRHDVMGTINVTMGNFTFTEADASATFAVEGGWVLAQFHSQDASGALQPIPIRYSVSASGNITTITVYGQEGVTTGKFLIFHR